MGETKDHEWLLNFKRCVGRPLRVLIIGNIANNGYLNAKALREYGVDAYVLAVNDYFIMSSPVWEEMEVSVEPNDAFFPDWWSCGVVPKNPPWFIQAPTHAALDYLAHHMNGATDEAKRAWLRIEFFKWVSFHKSKRSAQWKTLVEQADEDPQYPSYELARKWEIDERSHDGELSHNKVGTISLVSRLRAKLKRNLRRVEKKFGFLRKDRSPIPAQSKADLPKLGARRQRSMDRHWSDLYHLRTYPDLRHWRKVYGEQFPDRTDALEQGDINIWGGYPDVWREVFDHFDVVIATATYGAIPMLVGLSEYFCYEHGTIRDIPFEKDGQGRVCALTYRNAAATFITNTDVLPQAKALGIREDRTYKIPHAFDSTGAISQAEQLAGRYKMRVSPPTFIAPARQHWKEGYATWLKGNNLIVEAASRLKKDGYEFHVEFVEWGKEVPLTKQLIQKLECEDVFSWVSPMSKPLLRKAYAQSVAILDQYIMPAMGTATIEGLAAGRRVISYIDEPVLESFFGKAPPIMNAGSADELYTQMKRVLEDVNDEQRIGAAGQAWVRDYHSSDVIVQTQVSAFSKVLGDKPWEDVA